MSAPSPVVVVMSAPSGAGKSTLKEALLKRRGDIRFSVSATTRAPRAGERDGVDYHFVSREEFRRMIEADELLEHFDVHGNFYGTLWRYVREAEAAGQRLLLDIDVQGARRVRQRLPDAVDVFILPPSGKELVRRLTSRGTDAPEVIRRRLRNARDEVADAEEFRYAIVNDEVERAVDELDRVFRGEGASLRPVPDLHGTVQRIVAELDEALAALPEGAQA